MWNIASFHLHSSHKMLVLLLSSLLLSKLQLNFTLIHQVPVSYLREVSSLRIIWEAEITITCRCLPLLKSSLYANSLLQRRYINTCFADWNRNISAFMKKVKCENSVQCLFCSEPLQRQHAPPTARTAPPSSFLRSILSISAWSHQNFELGEHLCFSSIYSVHLLARWS